MTTAQERLTRNALLLRNSKGLSQERLSNAIHLTRTTYCCYEKGTKPMDLQTIDALANLYDVSFDSLVNYDLTEGVMNRVYLSEENKDLADLLNAYQYLSIPSKFLLSHRLDMLEDKERSLYPGIKK